MCLLSPTYTFEKYRVVTFISQITAPDVTEWMSLFSALRTRYQLYLSAERRQNVLWQSYESHAH